MVFVFLEYESGKLDLKSSPQNIQNHSDILLVKQEGGKINSISWQEEQQYYIAKRYRERKMWFIAYNYDLQQNLRFLLLKFGQPCYSHKKEK